MSRPTPETVEYKEAQDYPRSAFVVPLAQFLEMKQQRDELQNSLKRAITELDLAGIEIFKWERDFTILVNDFKAFANRIKKQ